MTSEERISITLTKREFMFLHNDLIHYIDELEDKGMDQNNIYGYLSRKRLQEKMRYLYLAYFNESASEGK